MYVYAIGMAIASTILYHVSQKLMPGNANPIVLLGVSYSLAVLICLILLLILPFPEGAIASLRLVDWTSGGLAIATVGSALGFLLAYRAGWRISSAALVSTSAVAILLLPVGFGLFRERPTPLNVLGVIVCIVGMVLVNWK